MSKDLWSLYTLMLKSRLFEQAITKLWNEGRISGELSAILLEAGVKFQFARVCTQGTIPYARSLEDRALPNVDRIIRASRKLFR